MAPEKAFGFQRDTKSLLINGSMQFDAITPEYFLPYSTGLITLGFVKEETRPEAPSGRSVPLILTQQGNPGLLDERRRSSLVFGGLRSTLLLITSSRVSCAILDAWESPGQPEELRIFRLAYCPIYCPFFSLTVGKLADSMDGIDRLEGI